MWTGNIQAILKVVLLNILFVLYSTCTFLMLNFQLNFFALYSNLFSITWFTLYKRNCFILLYFSKITNLESIFIFLAQYKENKELNIFVYRLFVKLIPIDLYTCFVNSNLYTNTNNYF